MFELLSWVPTLHPGPTAIHYTNALRRDPSARREGQPSASARSPSGGFDLASECAGVDRREPVQLALDLIEVLEQSGRIDQSSLDHCRYVATVLRVATLDLCQRLRV